MSKVCWYHHYIFLKRWPLKDGNCHNKGISCMIWFIWQDMAWSSVQEGTYCWGGISTLRPRQNGHHFADDTFEYIFMNENVWISIKISMKFVPKGPINNIPALVLIMAWRLPGDKPLSEQMMVKSLTHICVNRPEWVNLSGTLSCRQVSATHLKSGCPNFKWVALTW